MLTNQSTGASRKSTSITGRGKARTSTSPCRVALPSWGQQPRGDAVSAGSLSPRQRRQARGVASTATAPCAPMIAAKHMSNDVQRGQRVGTLGPWGSTRPAPSDPHRDVGSAAIGGTTPPSAARIAASTRKGIDYRTTAINTVEDLSNLHRRDRRDGGRFGVISGDRGTDAALDQ